MPKTTRKDILKILEEKVKEKIKKIKKVEKYDIHICESDIYPSSKECDYSQHVWISEKEKILIKYTNFEDWGEKCKESEKQKNYKFQEYIKDWEKMTRIEIRFEKENLLIALEVLFLICNENTVEEEEELKIFINNDLLEIYPITKNDKLSDSLDGLFIKIKKEKLIEKIEKNIRNEMSFNIITTDHNSMNMMSGLKIYLEYYYYDEYYLYDIEQKRLDSNKR